MMTKSRIAIAEDEYLIALCFEDILAEEGYEVRGIFSSAEELLGSLEHDAVDLVLMDVNLAGNMNGMEATRSISEKWHTPVIVLTGYGDQKTRTDALQAGAAEVLNKPIANPRLLEAVRAALAR